jgi:hypothetical protein
MIFSSALIENAVNEFARLPGIGKPGITPAEAGPWPGEAVWRCGDPYAGTDQVLQSMP